MLRRRRWRAWIASCALVTLAWPSLGPLPWVVVDFAPEDHAAAHHAAEPDAGHSSTAHHDHGDASDIPGSPTHPADHDCAQCQVLKQLSRCAVQSLAPPTAAPDQACAVQPRAHVASRYNGNIATLPPIRGPPLSIA